MYDPVMSATRTILDLQDRRGSDSSTDWPRVHDSVRLHASGTYSANVKTICSTFSAAANQRQRRTSDDPLGPGYATSRHKIQMQHETAQLGLLAMEVHNAG